MANTLSATIELALRVTFTQGLTLGSDTDSLIAGTTALGAFKKTAEARDRIRQGDCPACQACTPFATGPKPRIWT